MIFALAADLGPASLLTVVFTFNILAVLLWFLLRGLQRNHRVRIHQLRELAQQLQATPEQEDDLRQALEDVRRHLTEAEQVGPLHGRKPLSAAHGILGALLAQREAAETGETGEGGERGKPGPE